MCAYELLDTSAKDSLEGPQVGPTCSTSGCRETRRANVTGTDLILTSEFGPLVKDVRDLDKGLQSNPVITSEPVFVTYRKISFAKHIGTSQIITTSQDRLRHVNKVVPCCIGNTGLERREPREARSVITRPIVCISAIRLEHVGSVRTERAVVRYTVSGPTEHRQIEEPVYVWRISAELIRTRKS